MQDKEFEKRKAILQRLVSEIRSFSLIIEKRKNRIKSKVIKNPDAFKRENEKFGDLMKKNWKGISKLTFNKFVKHKQDKQFLKSFVEENITIILQLEDLSLKFHEINISDTDKGFNKEKSQYPERK